MRIDCPLFLQESSTGLREIPLKQPLNQVLSRRDQESIDTGGTYHLAFSSVTQCKDLLYPSNIGVTVYSMRGMHERMVLIRGRTIHVPSAGRYVPGELTGWFADFEPLIRATFLNAHCPGMNVGALVVTAYMLLSV